MAGMARRWRIRSVGARYHVTSRGNGREKIFYGDEDRETRGQTVNHMFAILSFTRPPRPA